MGKYICILFIIFSCSCNNEVVYITETETYPISINAKLQIDSLKYVFDINKGNSYIYYIQYLKYHRVDSINLYQGDIEISSNISQNGLIDTSIINRADTITAKLIGITANSEERMWENRRVRFKISTDGTTPNLRSFILKAISEWEKTGLNFDEISDSRGDYILFESLESYKFNSSPIGRQNNQQKIKLAQTALVGNIIHEIGHAIGLWHEHSRPDRGNFIRIIPNNIETGYAYEFDDIKKPFSYHNTSYDYESIMHYGESAFAKTDESGTKLITIQPLKIGARIGQRSKLSQADIDGVKKMYKL